MIPVSPRTLPPESLLAQFAGKGDYTDCFTADLPRAVSLQDYISAFYNSPAFRPERWVLYLIGKGSGAQDVRKLAAGKAGSFAAWSMIGRNDCEILLQDFQHRTCSWLMVSPANGEDGTRLSFGSGVRKPDGAIFRALMPFHRWYAQTLLGSAAKRLQHGGT